MAQKLKVCKECGKLVDLDINICPACNSNNFNEKFKGMAEILNVKESEIAKQLNVEHNGTYALKY